jgi:DNA (cytosine-5)-methyltransferase 1
MIHWESPHEMSNEVLALCNTFPIDYDYLNVDPKYLIGMSVPPVMIAQIANQIKTQWLKRI